MIHKAIAGVLAVAVTLLSSAVLGAEGTLTVPFDFSRHAIGLNVTVKGAPVYMILDTGVDPSGVDLKRAEALGLPVQRDGAGEATGEGDAKSAQIYPASIDDLVLGGRAFGSVDAAAMDMSALSARYGRPLDGVLGYSFLNNRIVLIDYPGAKLSILDRVADAVPLIAACRTRFSFPLRANGDDMIPVIPDFRFGTATAPITLDTGSTGSISLYGGALDLPGLRQGFVVTGRTTSTGARGNSTSDSGVLNMTVGFGPFTLPPGQSASLRAVAGSPDTRLANIGNKLFAAMKLKMLLDYKARQMTFYGDCKR
jgi:hypothetical protein